MISHCPNLVRGPVAYCPKHIDQAPTGWSNKKEHEHQKIYHTQRWMKTSRQYRKENPLCVECKKEGIIKSADVVDHIKPIQDGGEVFDWDNFQSLCHSHHNSKTAKENARKRR